ncbi:MAG: hypothetical protein AAF208_04040 [Cyanobacteria bacterium P01_A01_bin.45]
MKYFWSSLLHKVTLVAAICLLIFSTAACTDTLTTSPTVESTSTPTPASTPSTSETELPVPIKSAVLSNASKQTSKSVAKLRITQTQKQNWGNSCLGLAQEGEICAQVITPGWKVVVSDGQREFIYRTDESGKQVKLENLSTSIK